jgi:hypothetical protein
MLPNSSFIQRAVFTSTTILVLIAGCTIVYPLGDYRSSRPVDAGSTDEAVVLLDSAPDSEPGTCGRAIPTRPAGSSAPNPGELFFALDTLEVGNDLTTLPFTRYNLDGLCTCPVGVSACVPPAGERPFCDQPGGVDNSGGAVLDYLFRLTGSKKSLTERLKGGSSVLGLRLRNYTGAPDDSNVEAMVIPLVGISNGSTPKWDGTDIRDPNEYWLVSKDPVVSKIFDPNAYVRNGVLVMSFSGAFPISDLVLNLTDAKIVGKLEGGRMVEGHLLGRVKGNDTLRALSRFPNPSKADSGTCDGIIFDTLRDQLCKSRDLPIDPKKDGLDSPCESLSLSLRFTTQKFVPGIPVLEAPLAYDCGPTLGTCP